jgi:hypothetical protein
VSLACPARAHLGPEAADRPSLGGIEEDHVARGHEADGGVRVAAVVEHEHVRPHGIRAGLGQAERRRLGPEIDGFRCRAGRVRPQLIGIVDVERAAERLAVRIGLIEQPDLVIEAARDARRVRILGRRIEERHALVGRSIPRQPTRAVIAQRQRQCEVGGRGRRVLRFASGAEGIVKSADATSAPVAAITEATRLAPNGLMGRLLSSGPPRWGAGRLSA